MPDSRRAAVIVLGIAILVALAGCASFDSPGSGRAAEAPAYRIGDRWVYKGQDGFRLLTTWDETHTIIAVGAEGIGERVTVKGPSIDLARAEQWPVPGRVKIGALYENETRRFATPLDRYRFPLAEGASWNQFVDNFDESTKTTGQINNYVRVRGWETVVTPAGTFDAIVIHTIMWLDDGTFWRWPTQCNYTIWYAPAVRGVVREVKQAQYLEKGGDMDNGATIRTQNALVELVSFTPGS